MKLKNWTARILGVLIILSNLLNLIGFISDPIEVRGALVVGSIVSLLWVAFGAFLIVISLKMDVPSVQDEDEMVRLKRNRNWIFAFILLTTFLSSAEAWLMNDYTAGLNPTNLMMIFDLVLNLVLGYFVVRLLQDKNKLPKGFLVTIVIYSIGLATLYVWRGFPLTAVGALGVMIYFTYASIAPVTKRNHQIAHFALLPIMLALLAGLVAVEGKPMQNLVEREAAIDEQYSSDVDIVASTYGIYLEKDVPSRDDIRDVQESIARWNATADENIVVIEALERENRRQLPSVTRDTNLEYWRQIRGLIELRREQFEQIQELMEYVKTINLNTLSQGEGNRINALEGEVLSIGDRITDAETHLSQSLNLE